MKNKTVIYTAIFDGYDLLREPTVDLPSCDLVCFTDDKELKSNIWDVRYVDSDGHSGTIWNRRFKMLPHEYFGDYENSLYIDGNVRIIGDPIPWMEDLFRKGIIAIPPHPERQCIFEEIAELERIEKVSVKDARIWVSRYQGLGVLRNSGLYENSVILRRHNDPAIISLMSDWWAEFSPRGGRDQLSLILYARRQGIEIIPAPFGPRVSRELFDFFLHEPDREKSAVRQLVRYLRSNRQVNKAYAIMADSIDRIVKHL